MKMRPGAQLKPVTGIGSLIRWSVLALVCLFLPAVAAAGAKLQIDETRWVSLGGGLRASANFIEDAAPSGSDYSKDFKVNNARLYVNGQIFKGILATFNTEFVEGDEAKVRVLDGIVRLEFTDVFNVWLGRFLPPSDRANLDGPFYLLNLDFPIVSAFPAIFAGRDDGGAIWGELLDKHLKYQVGVFNGSRGKDSPNLKDNVLLAARLVYNFLDPEPGYYNASTYYGAKKILAVGTTVQYQGDAAGIAAHPKDFIGFNVDALFEYPLPTGVVTLEGGFYSYDYGNHPLGGLIDGRAYYGQAGFLFPQKLGIGQLQPVFRVQHFDVDVPGPTAGVTSDTTRANFGLNYIIAGHDARVMLDFTRVFIHKGNDHNEIKLLVQVQY